jgi:hypothetical protein
VPRALEPTSLQPLITERDMVRMSRRFDARLALNNSDPLAEPIRRTPSGSQFQFVGTSFAAKAVRALRRGRQRGHDCQLELRRRHRSRRACAAI